MSQDWREIKKVSQWDQADAIRSAILRDTPSLDVRLVYANGAYAIEVRGPGKRC